jgi:Cd(II)/Pb(II)-responsive transcriptional regulator
MKIGELAAATGTSTENIRFYEREGLLPVPTRSDGNYRIYGTPHQERLAFIRRCRSLDMTLDEIRALLAFKDEPEDNCEGINNLLDEHIEHVAVRIKELRSLEKQLRSLRDQCVSTEAGAACGILQKLAQDSPGGVVEAQVSRHIHGTH